jgi:hypothetical protein
MTLMRTRNAKLRLRESNSSRTTIVSNLFFIIGTGIILAALVYMIVSLDKADSIIAMWAPFMAAGVLLVFWGLILSVTLRKKTQFRSSSNRQVAM